MHPFEFRIFNTDGTIALVVNLRHTSNYVAMRAGHLLAEGKPYEVWRAEQCIYGLDDRKPLND